MSVEYLPAAMVRNRRPRANIYAVADRRGLSGDSKYLRRFFRKFRDSPSRCYLGCVIDPVDYREWPLTNFIIYSPQIFAEYSQAKQDQGPDDEDGRGYAESDGIYRHLGDDSRDDQNHGCAARNARQEEAKP